MLGVGMQSGRFASVERIEGIPPAIAIDRKDPVRTSRSTAGTMTEITVILFQKSNLKRHGTTAPELCFSTVEHSVSAVENIHIYGKSLTVEYKIVKEHLIAIQNSVRLTTKLPAPMSNPL